MESTEQPNVDFDVIIIGAGISGINTAYRIQTELPNYHYTILEARGAIGGTWDLFRYPGIRSDSDLYTFGFPWRPWTKAKAIAEGKLIREYITESAEQYDIDKRIRFHHKMLAADWSSEEQQWRLTVDANGENTIFRARFIVFSTGYYDYDEALKADIPGIESFKGTVIHPQFWPENFDYTGKRIVIIGSGATAVTLLPNLAGKAAWVTMLQRSPSYILGLPAVDPSGEFIRRWFSARIASTLMRWKFLVLPFLFFQFCRAYPNAARKQIRKNNEAQVPARIPLDPHFSPSYNPWEQRLCFCPDSDFFKALRKGNADIVTDHIKTVNATGIETEGGNILETDIIITATGLKMQLAGGAKVSVDGNPIDYSEKYLWKGAMMQDVPNSAFIIGYTNASWTLGAETTAQVICRILKYMDANNQSSTVPRVQDKNMKSTPILNLNSTYIEKAKGLLPMAGNVTPWKPRSNYFIDYWITTYGVLTNGLQFTKRTKSE